MKKILPLAIYITDIALLSALACYIAADMRLARRRTVFYYGYNCPHCANVEKFMDETGLGGRLGVFRAEVQKKPRNMISMSERALSCGQDLSSLQIPFLWDAGRCVAGETALIEYLKTKDAQSK